MTHRVTIAELDRSFEVDDDETMLTAALRANIHIPHDCKSGTCATCRYRLIAGEVAYREDPMALAPEEQALEMVAMLPSNPRALPKLIPCCCTK